MKNLNALRKIRKIYIHCSASRYGTVEKIRQWHINRGFSTIGYHFIILNPFSTFIQWFKHHFKKDYIFTSTTDGKIELGRDIEIPGAHVKGDNKISVCICYIGVTPTISQYISIARLCIELMIRYNLTISDIHGHYEYNSNKTCPNFNMDTLRWFIGILS